MLKHNLHGCAWGYVFKKSVLDGLRFTSGIYHEDEEFTPLLFLKARHVIITNLPAYAYFQRQYSIIHHPDRKIIKKRYSDLQHIILCLTDKGRQMEGNAAIALNRRIDMLRMSMVYTLLGDSPDTAFLLETLENMKRTGLYPLHHVSTLSLTPSYVGVLLNHYMPSSSAKCFAFFNYAMQDMPHNRPIVCTTTK